MDTMKHNCYRPRGFLNNNKDNCLVFMQKFIIQYIPRKF